MKKSHVTTIVRRLPVMSWPLFMLAAGLVGCGESPTLGPPQVRWGQDVCSSCSMILSEDRYAAAIVSIQDNERNVLLFDDVGEMFEYQSVPVDSSRHWVCDAQTRQWIDAQTAYFVRSPEIHTPMGRGIEAFAHEADAKKKQDEVAGELLRFDDLNLLPHDTH